MTYRIDKGARFLTGVWLHHAPRIVALIPAGR